MASDEASLRKVVEEKLSLVDRQADTVRKLKSGPAGKAEIDASVEALKALKLDAESAKKQLLAVAGDGGRKSVEEFRQTVVNTLERKLFYMPSFKIYGGVAGLYDYGPPGCRVKSNVLSFWRQV